MTGPGSSGDIPASMKKGPAAVAKRTVCALTAAAAVCALFFCAPPWVAPPLLVILAVLCQAELCAMVSRVSAAMPAATCAATAAMLLPVAYLPGRHLPAAAAAAGIVLFALAARGTFAKRPARGAGAILASFGCIAFIAPQMACFLLLARDGRPGLMTLFYIVCTVKISDMGGYAFGKAFGRHKMCPGVSPNKSWEGLAGGLFGSVLVSCAFCAAALGGCEEAAAAFKWGLSYPAAVCMGAALCAAGTLGDLAESAVKRACGVKDSSNFLPAGMGGFLDTFDSILFAPMLYLSAASATAAVRALCGT